MNAAPAAADGSMRVVFRHPTVIPAGGGGGGGNRQPGPIRRAQGVGHDAQTLRTTTTPPTVPLQPGEPIADRTDAVLLDARPLASGTTVVSGLPTGSASGLSLGPGDGGGVGSGHGTGIGSGVGPGLGPGSGGGTGGGVYRPGGGVTAPRLIRRVDPKYTDDALERRVQGSVWLSAVVNRRGEPTWLRVTRLLDAGLDLEALNVVAQWRFEPGQLRGVPVDVEVVIVLDFTIR